MWAAFFPENPQDPHPLFPRAAGPAIHDLTMFADYRVPQILHHLRMLIYPPSLVDLLQSHKGLAHGSREEISIRAASIVAVEKVREEIKTLRAMQYQRVSEDEVTSALGPSQPAT